MSHYSLLHVRAEGSYPVMMIFNQGKTNRFNRTQTGACMRNPFESKRERKEPVREADSTILGDEDEVSSEEDENETVGENALECPISKASHSRFMRSGFEAAGIFVSKKVTHVPRASSAKMADLAGVPESQIRSMGQWNTDTMSNAYLDSLPREFVR
ncbi:hypothetical protein BD560DRAFT_433340, partial [Blakeslea trispora]